MSESSPRPATRLPAVRARYMQTFSDHVERLRSGERAAIRAAVPEGTWQQIESAGLLGWLPMSVNLACTRAVSTTLGAEGTHTFFRQLLLDTSDTPLLRGLVQSVLRVAVRDPGLYLPWVAKGFELMFRDVGRWRFVDRDAGSALLEISGLPRECLVDDVWPRSVASALVALLDLVKLEGDISMLQIDAGAGVVTFKGSWKPR